MRTPPREGETYTRERTFTEADVREFAAVTGDTQPRHTDPDDRGRLMVHGLLTGSLLTDVGGDLELLAREMVFRFRRPVYTGERVRCEWTTEAVTERARGGWEVKAEVVFRRVGGGEADGSGRRVLEATVEGVVRE